MNRWRWLVGTTAAVAVAVVSWSPPTPTPTNLAPVASAATPDEARAQAELLAVAPGPRVAVPWRPGRPELGIHVYWEDNPADSDEVVRRKARRLLDQVIGMETNAMAVSFPFFTDSLTASSVHADQRTPSPARIGIVMEQAQRMGLRTTLRPLLDQTNLWDPVRGTWRGLLAPADRGRWYASYQGFLTPYLAVAESQGIDTMVLAAELSAMQRDPQWASLVTHARGLYAGTLGYSANWDAYQGAVDGVPVDSVGIDAYPLLGLGPRATEQEMTSAWRNWLDRTAPGGTAGLVLSEVGAPAESSLLDNPAASHTAGTALDEGIQRRWFAAACQAARDRQVAGLYWWKFDFHLDPALADPDEDLHDSFLGREAERTVRECFSAWGGSP